MAIKRISACCSVPAKVHATWISKTKRQIFTCTKCELWPYRATVSERVRAFLSKSNAMIYRVNMRIRPMKETRDNIIITWGNKTVSHKYAKVNSYNYVIFNDLKVKEFYNFYPVPILAETSKNGIKT